MHRNERLLISIIYLFCILHSQETEMKLRNMPVSKIKNLKYKKSSILQEAKIPQQINLTLETACPFRRRAIARTRAHKRVKAFRINRTSKSNF